MFITAVLNKWTMLMMSEQSTLQNTQELDKVANQQNQIVDKLDSTSSIHFSVPKNMRIRNNIEL